MSRTQYLFDLSGVKYKSRSDILTMRNQWNTFERVENYNHDVYQRLMVGDRGKLYYQFTGEERIDYKKGQLLHIARYPWLPPSTFDSISNLPPPNVQTVVPPVTAVRNNPSIAEPLPASERTSQTTDLTVYNHVSTYNATHVYKYTFASNEEQMAYNRAARLLNISTSV